MGLCSRDRSGKVLHIAWDWDNAALLFWASLASSLTSALFKAFYVCYPLKNLVKWCLVIVAEDLLLVPIGKKKLDKKATIIQVSRLTSADVDHLLWSIIFFRFSVMHWCLRLHSRLMCGSVMNQYCAKCWLQYSGAQCNQTIKWKHANSHHSVTFTLSDNRSYRCVFYILLLYYSFDIKSLVNISWNPSSNKINLRSAQLVMLHSNGVRKSLFFRNLIIKTGILLLLLWQ